MQETILRMEILQMLHAFAQSVNDVAQAAAFFTWKTFIHAGTAGLLYDGPAITVKDLRKDVDAYC